MAIWFLVALILPLGAADTGEVDLTSATIVVRGSEAPIPEQTAAKVLAEEVEKRTGLRWPVATRWPPDSAVIAVMSGAEKRLHGEIVPARLRTTRPEGYGIGVDTSKPGKPIVWIVGADPRGALYGVGRLLRNLHWEKGTARLTRPLAMVTAPAYAIRGHQLGYRARANSYDAWDAAQYEQYIRELALFGVNSIENIPFQDTTSTLMKLPRRAMNRELAAICARYGLDYWVWSPADFDLNDANRRAAYLDEHEDLFAECPRLDAVFFPGGDPGDNHPRLVLPLLEELSRRLARHHPQAKIWISLQGFDKEEVDYFYRWLGEHEPDWLGGVVAGPSSPPIPRTRARLPHRYGLRHYPDITHTVRCQYPVLWWDPAFAFTLGREPINPRPLFSALVHNALAPYTDGFLTYSDGVNDDVNKTVWSALGWEPATDVRTILVEYCRVFFGPAVAEEAADGILALERNWDGPLATHGGVDATLALWQREAKAPGLPENWRWQQCLLRAYYDAYTRRRLIDESGLEREANAALSEAATLGADAAMEKALAILKRADTARRRPELRARVEALCDALFHSIGLQTSVEKYQASGAERGAVLDYLDYPLNNRWWVEDEIAKVRALPTEKERLARLETLRTWEDPGPGSFYDDIGNVAKSPHVIRGKGIKMAPGVEPDPIPDFMWWDAGRLRVRQSWMSKMDWPLGLRYKGLESTAAYVVRTTGYGQCLLRMDGVRVPPTLDGKDVGEIKEFPVPRELVQDRTLVLTFDVPSEPHVNWRLQSRLTEVWLIRLP
jgi:hypothetical protein